MSITFTVESNPEYTWKVWGDASYCNIADVIGELVDNSLQAKATECRVTVDIDEDSGIRYLTVEDNGTWDKKINDKVMLKRCFGYGKTSDAIKEGLNEHNAGLKQVLAYTDPTNSKWIIQIKQEGVVWELRAPYMNEMSLNQIDPCMYEGVMTVRNSTLIRTVISDRQMKSLYIKIPPKGINEKSLKERLELHLATMWMMHEQLIDHTFRIYLNDKFIKPFVLEGNNGVTHKSEYKKKYPLPVGPGEFMNVDIWQYLLDKQFGKTIDHPIFRNNTSYSGVCIFKHGRLIKSKIFEDIYKIVCDAHMTGHLVLVNITGDSKNLPSTYTTKNDFNNKDEKLAILYDLISEKSYPQQKRIGEVRKKCEKEMMSELEHQKKKHNEDDIKSGTYHIEPELYIPLTINDQNTLSKDRVDLLEWNTRQQIVTITEGKLDQITPENLRQLYFYYRSIRYFCPKFDNYTIKLRFITLIGGEAEGYDNELRMIQEREPDFKPSIQLFSEYGIHSKTD